MARSFLGSSNQYFRNTSFAALNGATAASMFAVMRRNGGAGNAYAGYRVDSNNNFGINLYYSPTVGVNCANGTSAYTEASVPGSDVWFRLGASYAGGGATDADKVKLYVNGADTALTYLVGSPPSSLGTLDNFDVGYRNGAEYSTGSVAEVAVWSVTLSAQEHAALADGVSPLLIRPQSLIGYWPLLGRATNEEDWVGGYTLTPSGGSTVAEHPRIVLPPRRRIILPSSSGTNGTGGGATYLAASTFVAGGATGVRNASAGGATWLAAATWLGGGGTAGVNGTGGGSTWLAAASYLAGGATGVRNASAGGTTWLAAATYVPGGAAGTAFAGGATWLAASSFIGGGANAVRNASAGGVTWTASATWLNGGAFGNTPSDLQRWRWVGLPISLGL